MKRITNLAEVPDTYRGLYARVAAHLDVSPSYVPLVANGKRRNKRIEQALAEELARCQKVVAKARAASAGR